MSSESDCPQHLALELLWLYVLGLTGRLCRLCARFSFGSCTFSLSFCRSSGGVSRLSVGKPIKT